MKYPDTNGIAAFVGLWLAFLVPMSLVCPNSGYPNSTDELMKSAAYMTDAYLQSRGRSIRTPFEHAFNTNVGYFEWLEGQGAQEKPVPKGGRQRLISSLSRTAYCDLPPDRFLADPETNITSRRVAALSVGLRRVRPPIKVIRRRPSRTGIRIDSDSRGLEKLCLDRCHGRCLLRF